MKTLLLMRHAKSAWDKPGLSDFERPLAPRGKREAPRMGKFLAEAELLPDLIVSSPAVRARATAELVMKAAAYTGPILFDPRIYDALATDLIEISARLAGNAERVMLVGHNPGFEDVIKLLGGGAVRMPTAAIACVELAADRWTSVEVESGTLGWLATPGILG